MNAWFKDRRVEKAEADAFEAERAERRGDVSAARGLYHQAAEGFASVALSVPADHPNTRSDLAIAAVASFARAGDFGRSIEFGRRILAEGDALTEPGRMELTRLVYAYTALVAQQTLHYLQAGRGPTVREQVRSRFKRVA
jgi:hypothetical protein